MAGSGSQYAGTVSAGRSFQELTRPSACWPGAGAQRRGHQQAAALLSLASIVALIAMCPAVKECEISRWRWPAFM